MGAEPVTEAAVDAALKAAPDQHVGPGHWAPVMSRADMRRILAAAAPHLAAERRCVQCNEPAGETDSTVWHEGCLDVERTAVADLECEEHDKRIAALEAQLEHAKSALAGNHEGIRLWMLDCAEMSQRRGDRIAALERLGAEQQSKLRDLGYRIPGRWVQVLEGEA